MWFGMLVGQEVFFRIVKGNIKQFGFYFQVGKQVWDIGKDNSLV